jgi:hypothetical protein
MPFRELGKNGLTVMLISHRLEAGMILEGPHTLCVVAQVLRASRLGSGMRQEESKLASLLCPSLKPLGS